MQIHIYPQSHEKYLRGFPIVNHRFFPREKYLKRGRKVTAIKYVTRDDKDDGFQGQSRLYY